MLTVDALRAEVEAGRIDTVLIAMAAAYVTPLD
jgi:hypothetical protein